MAHILKEAIERVQVLEAFPYADPQPNIEAPTFTVHYDANVDYNFADRAAFETRWSAETGQIAQLKDVLKTGDDYISMLYTYRSCSKALPQVKTSEQENKNLIHEGTYQVLEPEIQKLKNFMYFQRDTIKLLCEHIKALAALEADKKKGKKKDGDDVYVPSESYQLCLIRLLDKLALLDALKNMKACLNNDFSFYKRAFGFLRKSLSGNDDQTQENHTLYLFLAHQNSITNNLKAELQTIPHFDDVISSLVDMCADFVELDRYLLSSEKHCLLRVIPYALILMDGDEKNGLNVFKNKKVKLSRYFGIFKKYPVVPLYGDMQITLDSSIRQSKNFDPKAWSEAPGETRTSIEYELTHHLERTRENYNEYLTRMTLVLNEVRTIALDQAVPVAVAKDVTASVLQGLHYLSDWTAHVLQQCAWKYAKPNNDTESLDASTVEYERVVRYNYKNEEKVALIDYIAMIKSLGAFLLKEDATLAPLLRTAIHDELQEFVQVGARDMLRHAVKKKKPFMSTELQHLRFIAADWAGGQEPVDPLLQGKKLKKEEKAAVDERLPIPNRATPPSPTQLELIRNIVYGLMTARRKDVEAKHLKVLEDFYVKSFFWPYLLNFPGTILAASDLGDLWYREFYLELSKRLQFPIDMSLPWILCDYILELKDASMMEYVFYPLSLYDDAAQRALSQLQQQFLYDEVEAEVNLCFDQLIYKLSEQVYTHFKAQAASIVLDKPYKQQLEAVFAAQKLHVPRSRYAVLMTQRHIRLLGRSINLNHMLSQRMNTYLRQNVDNAISRFEASDLTCVVELESMLNLTRLTHRLLAEHFELDPFDTILAEVNESISMISFHGRIVIHVIFEVMYDLCPAFVYNSITDRFVRSQFKLSQDVPRDQMPRVNPNSFGVMYGTRALNMAFSNALELYKHFFGLPHVMALVRLLGRNHMALLISECLQNWDLKLRNVLAPYVRELFAGMLRPFKLPILYDLGTDGAYQYFEANLRDIIQYPDLRSEVLQNFRELGNIILFVQMADKALAAVDDAAFVVSAPLLGINTYRASWSPAASTDSDPSSSSPVYTAVHNLAVLLESKQGLAKAPSVLREMVTNAWVADKMYRSPPAPMSMFKAFLQRISQILDAVRPEWSTDFSTAPPGNGVMNIDATSEFYRLWSALQFVGCMPQLNEADPSNAEIFGDGLCWAGITIVYFLAQEHRFNCLEFCYHVVNIEETGEKPSGNPAVTQQFFPRVSKVRDLNQTIFNTLRAVCPLEHDEGVEFHAPTEDLPDVLTGGHPSAGLLHDRSMATPRASLSFLGREDYSDMSRSASASYDGGLP